MRKKAMFGVLVATALLTLIIISGVKFEIEGIGETIPLVKPDMASLCCWQGPERTETIDIKVSEGTPAFFIIPTKKWEGEYKCKAEVGSGNCKVYVKMLDTNTLTGSERSVYFTRYYPSGTMEKEGEVRFNKGEEKVLIELPYGYKVRFWTYGNISAWATFKPYQLVYHSPSEGFLTYNSKNCRVTPDNEEARRSIDPRIVESEEYSYSGKVVSLWKDVVPPGECINFVKDWKPVIYDFLPTLDGKRVICHAGVVYDITIITLKSGKKIATFGEKIATYGPYKEPGLPHYDCCPGQKSPYQFCGEDWKWHEDTSANQQKYGKTCYFDVQCQSPYSFGGWELTGEPNKIKRGRCINGKCVYEYMTVECVSHLDCPQGMMCDVGRTWKCVRSEGTMLKPLPFSPQTTATSFDLLKLLFYVIIGLVILLIIVVVA